MRVEGQCPDCGARIDFEPSPQCIGVACSCGAFVPLPLPRPRSGGNLAEMLTKFETEDRKWLHRRLVAGLGLAVGMKEVKDEEMEEPGPGPR